MKTPIRFFFLSLFSLIGFCLAIFQTHHFFEVRNGMVGFRSFCTFGVFNCQAIDSSSYAQLLPGFPLASFVAGWMLSILIISLIGRSISWRREALRALIAMTSVALAFSAFYFFIMFAVLKVYCLLCIGIDIINIILFAIVVSLVPGNIKESQNGKSHWKAFAGIGVAGFVFALFLSLGLGGNGPSTQEINEIVTDILNSPVLPVTVDDSMPGTGPKNAPITIVKFSDFQCPGCRRAAYTLHPLLKSYEDKVRFVFRNFPLDMKCNRMITHPMHERSCEAARVVWCESQRHEFKEAYFILFDNQETLPGADLVALMGKNPSESRALTECVNSTAAKEAVNKDIEDGIRLNIGSTPTFFVNGHRIEGSLPTQGWSRLFDELLKKK